MLFNYLTVLPLASCSDCLLVFVCSCTNTYWGKQSTWGRLQTPSSIWQHVYIWTLSDSEWELPERRQTVYRWIHSFQGLLYLAQMFATIHHAYVTWIATSRAPGKMLIYTVSDWCVVHFSDRDSFNFSSIKLYLYSALSLQQCALYCKVKTAQQCNNTLSPLMFFSQTDQG